MPDKPKARKSPRRDKVYTMRSNGKPWKDIATVLNITEQSARNHMVKAVKLDGKKPLPIFKQELPELADADGAAQILDSAMEVKGLNREKFMKAAIENGMPERVADGWYKRIRAQYGAVIKDVKIFKGKELIEQIKSKQSMLIDAFDPYTVSQMGGRDMAVALAIFIDKMLLLEGKPTQHIDVTVSHRLEEMMPAFMEEARRRGITLDATPTDVIIQEEPK